MSIKSDIWKERIAMFGSKAVSFFSDRVFRKGGMYSDTDIMAATRVGSINISPFNPKRLQPNSYDVSLWKWFFEVVWNDDGPWYVGPVEAQPGERIYVPVGGLLLGATEERIKTVCNVTAQMQAKSTSGKKGITVCKCAGLGDIGYNNHWVMELTSFTRYGKPFVTVGESIAQLVFSETMSKPITPYQGQYNLDDWPICMVPEDSRHRIVPSLEDIPNLVESHPALPIVEKVRYQTTYSNRGKVG